MSRGGTSREITTEQHAHMFLDTLVNGTGNERRRPLRLCTMKDMEDALRHATDRVRAWEDDAEGDTVESADWRITVHTWRVIKAHLAVTKARTVGDLPLEVFEDAVAWQEQVSDRAALAYAQVVTEELQAGGLAAVPEGSVR